MSIETREYLKWLKDQYDVACLPVLTPEQKAEHDEAAEKRWLESKKLPLQIVEKDAHDYE